MSKKDRKSRRRSPTTTSVENRPNRLLLAGREILQQAKRNPETVLLVLAVVYLVFGLALMAAMGLAINPQAMTRQAPVFGAEAPEEQDATAPAYEDYRQPVVGTIAYGLLTVALWSAFALMRRRVAFQQRRFLMFLLTPGTLMFLVVAARLAYLTRGG